MFVLLILAWTGCSGEGQRTHEAAPTPHEAGAVASLPPMAYRFAVGEELIYDTTDVARAALFFKFEHTEVEEVCPLVQRADGSWRLLVLWTFNIDGKVIRDVCRIDLMPDGRLVDSNPRGYMQDLGPWRRVPAAHDGVKRDGDIWSFPTESGVWMFDAGRGRPVRVESETREDGQTQKRTTTFREAVRRDAEWIRRAERESEDVISTLRRDAFRYRGARADRIEAGYIATKEAWESLLSRTTLPELRGPVEDELSELESVARARRKDSEQLRALLDAPSPFWKLRDLEGKEHSRDEYRGSAVILEFWESG
jgi:hypothetical protein